MIAPFEWGHAVSAVPITVVASELELPASRVVEVARDLGLFRLRLGVLGELHISPAGIPAIRERVLIGAGRGRVSA